MLRIFVLACIALCINVYIAHAQTRDEIVVFVLLGYEPGDTIETDDGHHITVVSAKRVDRHTLEVELDVDGTSKPLQIREDPECVFEIIAPGQYKLDFNKIYEVTRNDKGLPLIRGKNVACRDGECFDFFSLGEHNIREKVRYNPRHLKATEYFRSKYCPGSPY
jgi:hypothetical protein